MLKTVLIFFFIGMIPLSTPSHMEYTEVLSKFLTKYPGVYVAISSSPDQRKLIVDNYALHKYYLKHNNPGDLPGYQAFLNLSLRDGFKFKVDSLEPYEYKFGYHFVGEKLSIIKEYQSKGINFITTKYLTKLGRGEFRNKVMDDDTLYGLIYIMSKNKYIASFSDYSGYYQFITVEKISEKIRRANRPE